MNLLREKLRAQGHHRAQFGGDSSSSSTQNTSYQLTDSRQVNTVDSRAYSDSRTFANSGNTTTTIHALDGGAIAAGRDVSLTAIKQNSTNTEALFTAADRLFTGTRQLMAANTQLAADLSTNAANAYEGATAQANGNKTMLLVGLAVVGVVAVMAFGKN